MRRSKKIKSDSETSEATVETFRCPTSHDEDWVEAVLIVTQMLPRRVPTANAPAELDAAGCA